MSSTGGVVSIPAGIYKITSQIVLKNGVSLIGAGCDSATNPTKGTIIRQYGVNANGVYMEVNTTNAGNLRISDLRIEAPAGLNTTGRGIYLRVNSTSGFIPLYLNMIIENIHIRRFGSYGLQADGLITSTINNVTAHTCGAGFYFNGDPDNLGVSSRGCTSLTITSCYANGNTNEGYKFLYTGYTVLSSCAADNNDVQYEFLECTAITLQSCGSEYSADRNPSIGIAYRILGSTKISLNNCSTSRATGGAILVGQRSAVVSGYITILGFFSSAPIGSDATVTCESGCHCMLINVPASYTTAGDGTIAREDPFNYAVNGLVLNQGAVSTSYNTDDIVNHESFRQSWSGDVFNMLADNGGTGIRRDVRIGYSTLINTKYSGDSTKILHSIGNTGSASKLVDSTGNLIATTGQQIFSALSPTIGQSGDGSYVIAETDVTENSTGSGEKYFNVWKVNNVVKAKVYSTGDIEVTSPAAGIILHSPNDTRYRIVVANDGTLSTTAL